MMKINRSKALILLSVVAFAGVCSGLTITAYASSASGNSTTQGPWGFMRGMLGQWFGFGGGQMNLMQAPGGSMQGMLGGSQMRGGFGPNGYVEVSAEFNQTVINIINKDSDVQNLLAQGYSVSAVRPIIKSVVQADGTVVTKATSAIVMLTKDTTGRATIYVDVTAGKVTQIVILTRTVIDKS